MLVIDFPSAIGKKTDIKERVEQRSKGEITREKILKSAIYVLSDKGIKGTTHRAIASHAGLQLSLTTYYFKDIQELIHQAFILNSTQILSRSSDVLEQAFTAINIIPKANLRKVAVKKELCLQLSIITANYLFEQIKQQSVSLTVEQILFTEIQVTQALRELAIHHESAQLEPYKQLCCVFNKIDPELDAKLMRTIFTQLKYSQLAKHPKDVDIENIIQITTKVITWIMRLK